MSGKHSHSLETYHSSVPHHGHPLLNPIRSLWNQHEVIFTNSLLSCGEASMGTGCHLEISTIRKTHTSFSFDKLELLCCYNSTNHARREVRY